MLETGVNTTMANEKLIEDSRLLKVNEIAEKAGVSRNVVWHYIKKNHIKPKKHDTKPYLFDANLVSKVVSKHRKTRKQTHEKTQTQTQTNTKESSNNAVYADVLKMFQTQIENLTKQIEFKDKQLEQQRHDIEYFQKQVIDTRIELKNNQKLLDSVQNHKETNVEENNQLKEELDEAQKQIESLKSDAERASELQDIVDKVDNASLWQRITRKFD